MNASAFAATAIAENTTQTISNAENATQALSAAGNATSGVAESMASAPAPVAFSWLGYFEAISVMFLLLAALWGVLWLARRYGKFRFLPAPSDFPANALRIEAQLPLGPRRGLYVIRYLDERLLIGVTEQQISLLQESSCTPMKDSTLNRDAQHFARLMEQEEELHEALHERANAENSPHEPANAPDRHDK